MNQFEQFTLGYNWIMDYLNANTAYVLGAAIAVCIGLAALWVLWIVFVLIIAVIWAGLTGAVDQFYIRRSRAETIRRVERHRAAWHAANPAPRRRDEPGGDHD